MAQLTYIPQTHRAGDKLDLLLSYQDYPATTYTLQLVLLGPSKQTINATASGSDHLVVANSAATITYPPGVYNYAVIATADGESYTLETGQIEILESLVATSATDYVAESHARRALAKLETAIENFATNPVESITIAGRTLTRPSITDLLNWRSRLLQEIRAEENAARVARGLGGRKILTRLS